MLQSQNNDRYKISEKSWIPACAGDGRIDAAATIRTALFAHKKMRACTEGAKKSYNIDVFGMFCGGVR